MFFRVAVEKGNSEDYKEALNNFMRYSSNELLDLIIQDVLNNQFPEKTHDFRS